MSCVILPVPLPYTYYGLLFFFVLPVFVSFPFLYSITVNDFGALPHIGLYVPCKKIYFYHFFQLVSGEMEF